MIRLWIYASAMLALTMTTSLPAASLAECAAITDDQQRLACFDEATRAPAATPPEARSAAEAVDAPAPVAAPAGVSAPTPVPTSSASISGTAVTNSGAAAAVVPTPTPAVVPTPAPAVVPAPAAAPATATATATATANVDVESSKYDELFGFENQVSTKGKQKIQSRIVGPFEGWGNNTVFRLENGQVWKQSDVNSRFTYRGEPQPVATIEKGYFGSFRLKIEGFNKRVKVKRIK